MKQSMVADEAIDGGYRLRLKSAGTVGAVGRRTFLVAVRPSRFTMVTLNDSIDPTTKQIVVFFYVKLCINSYASKSVAVVLVKLNNFFH